MMKGNVSVMKIAMIFDGLGWGGTERVGIDYVRIMKELGCDVDVYNLIPSLNAMESNIPTDVNIIHYHFSRFLSPQAYSRILYKASFCGIFLYIAMYIACSIINFLRRPFCRLKYGQYDIAIAFSGHWNDLAFISQGYVKSKKTVCWIHGALYQYIMTSFGYIPLYMSIKNLVVLSTEGDDEVLASCPLLKQRCILTKIYNPTFFDGSYDSKIVEKLNTTFGLFILTVARMEYPVKDIITLLEAYRLLVNEEKVAPKLVVVGDGPDLVRFKEYAIKLNLAERVVFEGARANVGDYYKACSFFVLSSGVSEGLPTVIIEAMTYSKPIVATDAAPGVREILGNNEYGIVVKKKSAEDLKKGMLRLVEDSDCYSLLAKASAMRSKDFEYKIAMHELKKMLDSI